MNSTDETQLYPTETLAPVAYAPTRKVSGWEPPPPLEPVAENWGCPCAAWHNRAYIALTAAGWLATALLGLFLVLTVLVAVAVIPSLL